jgi:hypothetical protein
MRLAGLLTNRVDREARRRVLESLDRSGLVASTFALVVEVTGDSATKRVRWYVQVGRSSKTWMKRSPVNDDPTP